MLVKRAVLKQLAKKKKKFRYRESNPSLLGESQVS